MSPPLSPIANEGRDAPALELPISPLAGEMPGRAEGGVTELGMGAWIGRDLSATSIH